MNKEVYKTYKCESCEKWFMNKDELNIHTTSVLKKQKSRIGNLYCNLGY